MSVEQNKILDWAVQEQETDISWIQGNLDLFWQMAAKGAVIVGRGAIVVDVVTKPMSHGNFFTYITQADMERFEDEDANRLIKQYEPESEFVVTLIKPKERTSSYQIRPSTSQ